MSQVLFQKDGSMAWITFNDPDRLNALTEEMGMAIEKLVTQINKDPSIRVVIITGAGRAFSAGGNLDIIIARTKKASTTNQKEMIRFYHRFLSLRKIQVPVIAMINGPAIGAAFCMTLVCDLRVAATTAKMGVNFVKIGLSPGMGGTFLLPQILGVPNAMDLLLTGRTITSEEALRRGIIHHLYAPEILREETAKLAQEITQNAPIAVKIAKQGVLKTLTGLEKSLLFESKGQAKCFQSKDIVEGISAIREKRVPSFRGI